MRSLPQERLEVSNAGSKTTGIYLKVHSDNEDKKQGQGSSDAGAPFTTRSILHTSTQHTIRREKVAYCNQGQRT